MLRLVIRILLICAGIVGVVLGAHGLYVHFSIAEFILYGKDPADLFLAIHVPSQFDGMVVWASVKGLESWFIPGCLIAGGIFLWYLQSNMYIHYPRVPRGIKKLWANLGRRKSYYDKHERYPVKDKANFQKKIIKTLFCITAIAIFIFLIWSAFFVFQRKAHPIWGLNPIVGAVAILLGILVLILNIRVLRSHPYRWTAPSFKLVLATLVVIFLVCAFAGVEPLSGYKDDAISGVHNAFRGQSGQSSVGIAQRSLPIQTPNTKSSNTYTLATENGLLDLHLLKEWSGTGNKKFYFDVSPGPVAVDWVSSQTSRLGASFMMWGGKTDVGDVGAMDYYTDVVGQRGYTVVNKSGHFIVEIESSGCDWTVRVGTE